MTQLPVKATTGAALAVPDVNEYADLGMEDFKVTDAVIPRLDLSHKEGVFIDNLTGEKFPELDVIVLGLVKQRIFWNEDQDYNGGPLCRSRDGVTGSPQRKDGKTDFPFKTAGFTELQILEEGKLACEDCGMKEWGTASKGGPACSEQFTLVVLTEVADGRWMPALMTLQKTGIKPSKVYISGFVREQSPMFVCVTHITLDLKKKGSVTFATPEFKRGVATDSSNFAAWAGIYRNLRTFLHSSRGEAPVVDASEADSPATTNTTQLADDDEPF